MQVRTVLAALFAILIILSFPFAPLPASACSCAAPPDPQTAKDQAAAVFTGKVIQVTDRSDWRKWVPFTSRPVLNGVEVVLDVQSTWKGVEYTPVLITTSGYGGSCGFPFQIGGEFLIYAYRGEGDELSTSICSRTTPLLNASADLLVLGPGSASPHSAESLGTDSLALYSVIAASFLAGAAILFLLIRKKRRR